MQATKSSLATAPIYATIPSKDPARARDFYENTLGLETMDSVVPGMFMVMAGKGTQFAVYQTDASTTATAATWMVDDLRAVVRELQARGVKFEQYDMPGVTWDNGVADFGPAGLSAWFNDSEGNALNIVQM